MPKYFLKKWVNKNGYFYPKNGSIKWLFLPKKWFKKDDYICTLQYITFFTHFLYQTTQFFSHITHFLGQITQFLGQITHFLGQITHFLGQNTHFFCQIKKFLEDTIYFFTLEK